MPAQSELKIAHQFSLLPERSDSYKLGPFESGRDFIDPEELFNSPEDLRNFKERLSILQYRLGEQNAEYVDRVRNTWGNLVTNENPFGHNYQTWQQEINWTYDPEIDFVVPVSDVSDIVNAKDSSGDKAVYGIYTRNEAANMGNTIEVTRALILSGMLDGVCHIDSSSEDPTFQISMTEGIPVIDAQEALKSLGMKELPNSKGLNHFLAQLLVRGEFFGHNGRHVMLSADPDYNVTVAQCQAIVGPLVEDPKLVHMKGIATRRTQAGDPLATPAYGGRVTEMTAKTGLRVIAPELLHMYQPLLGLQGYELERMSRLPSPDGYRMEIGNLLDVWFMYGREALGQAAVGVIQQQGSPNTALKKMAEVIAQEMILKANQHGIISVNDEKMLQQIQSFMFSTYRQNIVETSNRPHARLETLSSRNVTFPPPAILLES